MPGSADLAAQALPAAADSLAEFAQRAAYFDGDPVIAAKKGVNVLERASQVHAMAEMQTLFDFPPAPKLTVLGRLDAGQATESELRGQALFFGKALCATCQCRRITRTT